MSLRQRKVKIKKNPPTNTYIFSYVEMLEQQQAQLVAGLQESYRLMQSGSGWPGSPLKSSSNGHPLTHDILERLGTLKQEGHTGDEYFEEDLSIAQKRLLSNGAGYMQRQESSDGGSDSDHSPTFPPKPISNGSLNANLPPTPPSHSPYLPPSQQMPAQLKARTPQQQQQSPQQQQQRQVFSSIQGEPNANPIFFQRQMQPPCGIESQGSSFDDGSMDFIRQYENSMDGFDFHRTIQPTSLTRINPSLSQGWGEDDDFNTFMNSNSTLI